MNELDIINKIMTESAAARETRQIIAKARREDEDLIRKLENNDIYANKERDMDLKEDNICADERENPAWDMRNIDYL